MAEANYLVLTQESDKYYVPLAEFFDKKKQDTLVSETNIKSLKDDTMTKTTAKSLLGADSVNFKTINGNSIFGTGNIVIEGGGSSVTVDDTLSTTSTNPVQNKIITDALNNKQDIIGTTDSSDQSFNFIPNITKIATPENELTLYGSMGLNLVANSGAVTVNDEHYTQVWDFTEEAIKITFK